MEGKEHDLSNETSNQVLFIGLVVNFHATAMMALGKIANPLTQKIERNLEQAQFIIDMLGMLEAKTKGNLSEEETRTIRRILTELRMNCVDEMEKDKKQAETKSGTAPEPQDEGSQVRGKSDGEKEKT